MNIWATHSPAEGYDENKLKNVFHSYEFIPSTTTTTTPTTNTTNTNTTPPTPTNFPPDSDKTIGGLPLPTLIGVSVGCFIALVITFAFLYWFFAVHLKDKKKKNAESVGDFTNPTEGIVGIGGAQGGVVAYLHDLNGRWEKAEMDSQHVPMPVEVPSHLQSSEEPIQELGGQEYAQEC